MRNHVKTILVSLSAVLVLVAGTVVGTNLVTAGTAPGAGSLTVTFNYNGATGGTSVTSAIVTVGSSANTVLPHPTKSGVSFSGWFNTQSLLNGQRITTIEENDAGTLMAGYVPPELAQTLNLELPLSCAQGGTCSLGDIGPGGGLVFLISGGKTYEMAPKTWGDNETVRTIWCSNTSTNLAGTFNQAVGTGAANTALMAAPACTSGAANSATAYRGGGFTDWYLPSKDELYEMYTYKLVMTAGMLATYGFLGSLAYWSSSQQNEANAAWYQVFGTGSANYDEKSLLLRVRPVRAF